jgi:hypothetical protein
VSVLGCGRGVTIRSIGADAGENITRPESLFTALLGDHVSAGHVDYAALRHDERLCDYIGYLALTRPDTLPSARHRLAFWINAYNAYTLKVVSDNYPIESINELHFGGRIIGHVTGRTVWDLDFAVVGGTPYSLDEIEHDIIRGRFGDPRIHFALVCAARSCPPLRPEAYAAQRLDAQLDDQGRVFFSQAEKNRFDGASRTAYLSRILDWYREDFGENRHEVLRSIARYAPLEVRGSIESDPGAWRVEYTDYDWSLNGL